MSDSRTREHLVDNTIRLLQESGFEVSDRCNIRPKSFDIVASRGSLVLLIKILSNIDSFDSNTSNEMRILAHHLNGSSLIVGDRSRDRELEDGVVYLRHGVPAINLATAYEYFIQGVPPLVYMAPGGLYVNLDGDVLADLRESKDMSLGQIANEIGVSRRSVSKYESGMDATVDVALKLEEMFDEDLISPIDLFEMGEELEKEADETAVEESDVDEDERLVFNLLKTTGFDVLPTSKAPFRALSRAEETILTGISEYSKTMVKRARIMSSISNVAETESVYIVDQSSKKESIDDTVIVDMNELKDFDESQEFLDDIHEKKSSS